MYFGKSYFTKTVKIAVRLPSAVETALVRRVVVHYQKLGSHTVTITVNGQSWKLNIGCRTSLPVTELLNVFGVDPGQSLRLVMDGKVLTPDEVAHASVPNRATLLLTGVDITRRDHCSVINGPYTEGTRS